MLTIAVVVENAIAIAIIALSEEYAKERSSKEEALHQGLFGDIH